jgi:hypothetical protein
LHRTFFNDDEIGEPTSEKTEILWLGAALKFGHHDNFTKANSSQDPELKSSGFCLNAYSEYGIMYRSLFSSFYLGGYLPFPLRKVKDGYEHKNYLIFAGLAQRIRLFRKDAKINFTPILAYEWRDEYGGIIGRSEGQPDLLDKHYVERGALAGGALMYRIHREPGAYAGVLLEYSHRFFSVDAERYMVAIEMTFDSSPGEKPARVKEEKSGILSFHLGLEMERRRDGRLDWFITLLGGTIEGFNFLKKQD